MVMVSFEQVQKERDNKIGDLKQELAEVKMKRDALETLHSSLKIKYDSLIEKHETL
jgi:chromosome segregation ATPase